MKYLSIIIALVFCQQMAQAQQTPAKPQSESILIMNATAHIGDGEKIENSIVAFKDGKFTIIGDARTMRIDPSKFDTIIKAEGKHIYPGFIAMNSQIGLKEIDAVRATNDDYEVGRFNPSIRALIAYNTDSRVTPTIRSNGVMMAQIVPKGGRMPGQSSVMKLDGWNWEDAQYKADEGQHLNWPAPFRRGGWWAAPGPITKNKNYDKQVEEIRQFFNEAKAYSEKMTVETTNLKFEAMKGLFDGSKNLYVNVNFAKPMMEAVLFAEEFGITPTIAGGKDAWQVADFLKEYHVKVILGNTQAIPVREYDDIDQPYKNATMLKAAGVTFAFSMNGAWEQRNLVFQAGQAVSYGLDYEAAIEGLTLSAAKILGIDDKTGSLRNGKDATFILVDGDVLDMRTCIVEKGFIQGAEIDMDNKQKALSRKFTEKYGVDVEND
jgi:imidazolonepropionase-like amidohydrolase